MSAEARKAGDAAALVAHVKTAAADSFHLVCREPVHAASGLQHQSLTKLTAERCTFLAGALKEATLVEAQFSYCTFVPGALDGASLGKATFRGCVFDGEQAPSTLAAARFEGCWFRDCDLTGTDLPRAHLERAQILRGLTLPPRNLRLGMTCDVPSQLALGNVGRELTLRDDGHDLRAHYSGGWLAFNLVALAVFLAEPIAILVELRLRGVVCDVPGVSCRPLAVAFLHRLFSDGFAGWSVAITSLVGLLYNAARLALMVKAHTLATNAAFSLAQHKVWRWVYEKHRLLMWGNIGLLVLHVVVLLLRPVAS